MFNSHFSLLLFYEQADLAAYAERCAAECRLPSSSNWTDGVPGDWLDGDGPTGSRAILYSSNGRVRPCGPPDGVPLLCSLFSGAVLLTSGAGIGKGRALMKKRGQGEGFIFVNISLSFHCILDCLIVVQHLRSY